MRTLHLTNGDQAADVMTRSNLSGDVLPWRDVLHDGPVPSDHDRDAFHRARATFLAGAGWATVDAVLQDFRTRDARLDAAAAEDEVCLWFEPDLYDQLQLMQVLSRLAARTPEQRPRITIVPADNYLGLMTPEQMPPLFAARRDVTPEDLRLAADAWHAFTGAEPTSLADCVEALRAHVGTGEGAYANAASVRLPHLAAALTRMLEEYPDTASGLSRTERQLCSALARGRRQLDALWEAQQSAETWRWMGDASFASCIARVSDCAAPLVRYTDGSAVRAPAPGALRAWFDGTVQLTELGAAVLHGRADHVAYNGIDRWFGGAHATTAAHWRWDAAQQRLVPRAA